jgi:hypothetical protein
MGITRIAAIAARMRALNQAVERRMPESIVAHADGERSSPETGNLISGRSGDVRQSHGGIGHLIPSKDTYRFRTTCWLDRCAVLCRLGGHPTAGTEAWS